MQPTSPDFAPHVPEVVHRERIEAAMVTAPSIGLEKARYSTTIHKTPLPDIARELRLDTNFGNLEVQLQKKGLQIPPDASDRRKADILTTLAATQLIDEHHDNESMMAAAALLSTSYAPQAEMKSIMRDAKVEKNGATRDLQSMRVIVGETLSRGVSGGKVNRLMANCITAQVSDGLLDQTTALDIARSIASGKAPVDEKSNKALASVRTQYDIASILLSSQPRSGLKQEDVSFFRLGKLAGDLMNQVQQLSHPDTQKDFLKEVVDSSSIPERIRSLKDIIKIVSKNPEIRGVSFDMYDTLVQWTEDFWDRWGRYPDRIMRNLKELGYPDEVSDSVNSAVHESYGRTFVDWEKGVEFPLEQRVNVILDLLQNNPQFSRHRVLSIDDRAHLQTQLEKEFYRLELEHAVAMPGARETLAALKERGIKLGLTSNASWTREHIERVLKRFGLYDLFDYDITDPEPDPAKKRRAISLSSEHGRMKAKDVPDFFHHAWDKLGVPYGSILHVGDSAENDVQGARSAGALSTHYDNPLAYVHRIEKNNLRVNDPEAYALTAIEMQKISLEAETDEWIKSRISKRIPEDEQQRLLRISKELYYQSRDVIAPLHLNMADRLLQQLNNGETDSVLCLARDGLPISVAMKLLLHFDKERYPHVTSDQVSFVHASRKLLDRVTKPEGPEDEELKDKYRAYLQRKGFLDKKKLTLTDIVSGQGTTFKLMKAVLGRAEDDPDVTGYFIDKFNYPPKVHQRSFLQEALDTPETVLTPDTFIFYMETLFNGVNDSTRELVSVKGQEGNNQFVVPRPVRKLDLFTDPQYGDEHKHAFNRGLSPESVFFLNEVAIRGVMDSVRVRYRARVAGVPDPTDKDVATRFVDFIRNGPIGDLRLSVPWQHHDEETGREGLFLPSENEYEDSRIAKNNLRNKVK